MISVVMSLMADALCLHIKHIGIELQLLKKYEYPHFC